MFNQSINDQKCSLDNPINNDDYLHRKNVHLSIDQQFKVSKSEMVKIALKG